MKRKFFFLSRLVIIVFYFDYGWTSIMPELQLEMIAHDLSEKDCENLIEKITADDINSNNFEISNLKLKTCLDKLKRWYVLSGRENTFIKIANELKELGYGELSMKLSQSGLHWKSEKVERNLALVGSDYKTKSTDNLKTDTLTVDENYNPDLLEKSHIFEMSTIITFVFAFITVLFIACLFLNTCPLVRKYLFDTVRDVSAV